MIGFIIGIILSYCIGSIPFGFLIVKIVKSQDIRKIGSGNIGATNVFRATGKYWGITTLILDALKGLIAVVFVSNLALAIPGSINHTTMRIFCAIAVVCGHNWTLFLNFNGGKGMATTLGALIGFAVVVPEILITLIICLAAWGISFYLTRYVSLSSLLSAFLAPIILLVLRAPWQIVIFGAVLCIFIFFRHKDNISRLLEGKEHKINKSK